ncbi:fumarate reductase, cytochrome b subunit [Sulfurimonas gotlandica GD1]|uniref:Fumarate reductase cytochrome b subunit n=1 Tax=Sulfurimonas gotlandica (strain DSM 19862 / JCM 16533 / GD1) TaxID=929558 RepID=H1FVN8_SULGG|nr:fumarate reductase cytochrome b subunit [Sulfurimonas gotlandica]EHP29086.1 fumarate reductase, cytochrome b subunit [Sulfurimonas gotlandica GD1]
MKNKKIDKTPAILDFIQSSTGLILGVFIMGHILFESSILISNEMMYRVTIMFEGYYFFGETYPGIISFLAGAISIIFILHAGVALKKFPNNYRQHKIMRNHVLQMKHEDTSLWVVQIMTGFIMLFIGSVHLYTMMAEPSNIGPFASSYRVVHEHMAPLYFLLLLSVVSHAFIGLYRLAMKWGFMESRNTKVSRRRFKLLMKSLIVIYIVVGSLSLMKYIYIGYTNDFEPGTRYKSTIINLKAH